MDINVEVKEGLERRMTVVLPADQVEQQVERRLRSLAKNARLDGFRPGKAPYKLIRQRYSDQVTQEVMEQVMQSTFGEALVKEKIRPAGMPTIESREIIPDKGFTYTMSFEVYPEIQVKGLDNFTVEQPVVEITDDDVDQMVQTLREQRKTFHVIDREAQADDRVTIDFTGQIDGEAFEGGSGEKAPVVLGAGRLLKEFDEQLLGLKAGDEKTVDITFPEDYTSKEVAGKSASFAVKVHMVEEPRLPDLDEKLFEAFGIKEGGEESFRSEIRENMERELEHALRGYTKQQVMEKLLADNPVELPTSMVQEEIHRMRHQAAHDLMGSHKHADDHERLPDALFEDTARRRVALGILVAGIVKDKEIKLDQNLVRESIRKQVSSYEDPKQVEKLYLERDDLRQGVEALVLEDQAVDALLADASLTDKPMGFFELVKGQA